MSLLNDASTSGEKVHFVAASNRFDQSLQHSTFVDDASSTISHHQTFSDHFDDKSINYNYALYILFGTAFFCFVNRLTINFIPTSILVATESKEEKDSSSCRIWKWRNISTSLVHSILTGLAAPLILYTNPSLSSDMMRAFSWTSHFLVCFSVGYFIYDFGDMFIYHELMSSNRRSKAKSLNDNSMKKPSSVHETLGQNLTSQDSRNDWNDELKIGFEEENRSSDKSSMMSDSRWANDLFYHHACVILCFTLGCHTRLFIPYANVALMVEVNSIFLHIRQLLIIQGEDRKSTMFQIVAHLNIVTFVVFRFIVMIWMIKWLRGNGHIVPSLHFNVGCIGMIIIFSLTSHLFYKLLLKDWSVIKSGYRKVYSRFLGCSTRDIGVEMKMETSKEKET